MDWNVWGPPLAVLVVGVVTGGGLALAGRGSSWRHDPKEADLTVRKEVLLTQLRDLEGEQEKLDAATYTARREALLGQAAEVLRALEEGEPSAEPVLEQEGGNRNLLWYGVGVVVFFLLAGLALSKGLAPRGDGGMTGNAQSAGPMGEAQTAFAADPTNLKACNSLTKAAIYSGDLMAAMEQHDLCVALNREDPVVVAHGAAMYVVIGRFDEAEAMLQPHLDADPPVWEAQLWMGLVALNRGDSADGLDRLQRVADNSKDPLDVDFARFVIADVKASLAGANSTTTSDPHAETPTTDSAAMVTGRLLGTADPGGTLFIYVKNAAVDGGPPLGARKVTAWSLPMDFELGMADLLPFAGGQWPEPAYIKVKIARSGDPKVPQEGDLESEWIGPVAAASPIEITLGQPLSE